MLEKHLSILPHAEGQELTTSVKKSFPSLSEHSSPPNTNITSAGGLCLFDWKEASASKMGNRTKASPTLASDLTQVVQLPVHALPTATALTQQNKPTNINMSVTISFFFPIIFSLHLIGCITFRKQKKQPMTLKPQSSYPQHKPYHAWDKRRRWHSILQDQELINKVEKQKTKEHSYLDIRRQFIIVFD